MKKASLAFLSIVVFVSAAAGQIWYKGTMDQAAAKAKSEKKLVLVDFYSGG